MAEAGKLADGLVGLEPIGADVLEGQRSRRLKGWIRFEKKKNPVEKLPART